MPMPSTLTFNELTGEEARQVLEDRFTQIMDEVPYFQRHLTLPRVRMTLSVKLEMWADQPQPETVAINNRLTVIYEGDPEPSHVIEAEAVDSTAPDGRGGKPPDAIREMHGLAIPQPGPGPRNIGAHIQTSDSYSLDGREVTGMHGLKISRTGTGMIDGMVGPQGATIAKIDQGPAGLRMGQMNRDAYRFGGSNK